MASTPRAECSITVKNEPTNETTNGEKQPQNDSQQKIQGFRSLREILSDKNTLTSRYRKAAGAYLMISTEHPRNIKNINVNNAIPSFVKEGSTDYVLIKTQLLKWAKSSQQYKRAKSVAETSLQIVQASGGATDNVISAQDLKRLFAQELQRRKWESNAPSLSLIQRMFNYGRLPKINSDREAVDKELEIIADEDNEAKTINNVAQKDLVDRVVPAVVNITSAIIDPILEDIRDGARRTIAKKVLNATQLSSEERFKVIEDVIRRREHKST